jgi:anti-anti-sigma factor
MTGSEVRVLRPRGPIDLDAVQRLRGEWHVAAAAEPGCIVVDLSGVTFLDCAGIGLLVALLRRQRAHQGGLVLQNARPRIVRVLTLTGLADELQIAVCEVRPAEYASPTPSARGRASGPAPSDEGDGLPRVP